jgi:hypothetical protein
MYVLIAAVIRGRKPDEMTRKNTHEFFRVVLSSQKLMISLLVIVSRSQRTGMGARNLFSEVHASRIGVCRGRI